MLREYSQDLRWRAIWLTEIVSFDVEDVSFYLQLLKKTVHSYIHLECYEMSTLLLSVGHIHLLSMHPHEEWVVMQ